MSDPNLSSFIWSVADLLRGDYKQSGYGTVILPFTVLRRLDCVLEPTKGAVLAELEKRTKAGVNPVCRLQVIFVAIRKCSLCALPPIVHRRSNFLKPEILS